MRYDRAGYPPVRRGRGRESSIMYEMGLGISEDNPIVVAALERAGWHQTRALACLREARDPRAGPLSAPERQALLEETREQLQHARRGLQRAQRASQSPTTSGALEGYLQKLATVDQSITWPET
jgi:hypothetical protein